jgi:hypothetical protein
MLHVTNGDVAADALRSSFQAAQREGAEAVLPWRDVLHDGPVPEDLAPEALRSVRAAFLASQGWTSFAAALGDLRRRDAALAQATDGGVLWFEDDLYDQLQLLQAVDALARAGRTGGFRLVQAVGPLGHWTPEELAAAEGGAVPLTEGQVALARRAWAAFRAPTPEPLAALLGEDTTALPFLGPSLLRWFEELPAAQDGLARSERQLLSVLAERGPCRFPALFEAWVRHEQPTWMGDSSLRARLEALAQPPALLVARFGEVWALTPQGQDVLEGREDRVALGGLRRWWGGTQLDSDGEAGVWRWDAEAGELLGPG